MAQRSLISGTSYNIAKGKSLINGTSYNIVQGKSLINGTSYNINFEKPKPYAMLYSDGNFVF
jgi:hypothetical protein